MFAKMTYHSLEKKVQKFQAKRLEGDDTAAQKELQAWMQLASFLLKHQYSKKFPRAFELATEAYRNAAALGSADAQYHFGDLKVKAGLFWQTLSKGFMASKIQETYGSAHYEEAFSALDRAVQQGHPLAKRLLGLCQVKGWGKPIQTEQGTKLIIESIKEEGKWEQANKIFEELGLRSPDLFSSLMQEK